VVRDSSISAVRPVAAALMSRDAVSVARGIDRARRCKRYNLSGGGAQAAEYPSLSLKYRMPNRRAKLTVFATMMTTSDFRKP
jgi:hypothetical protein